jgi:intein/homing endonuclease
MKNKKIRENELSYLAGLWDGDGTFAIQRLKTSKTKSKRAYWVRSTFTNTNETVVKMVDSILKKMGIKKTGLRSRQRKENWKMTYEFSINRLEDNKTLLTNLIPYLNGKKATAEIVLRFVSRRLLAKKETPYNPYTLDDDLQYDQVKQMNIKGKYPDHKVVSDIARRS